MGELGTHGVRVGWELAGDEWERLSHVTVLNGRLAGEPASLCLFNIRPLIVAHGTADLIARLARRSIGVPGARGRWDAWRRTGDPEEARSPYWKAMQEGVHPRRLGIFMLDRLDTDRPEALRRKRGGADTVRDGALTYEWQLRDPAPGPAEQVEPRLDAQAKLDALLRVSDADERRLIEALLAEPDLPRTEVYRRNGWDPKDAEAVLKRLRRRHGNN